MVNFIVILVSITVNLAVRVLLDLLTICINFVVGYKVFIFIDVMELKNVYELIQERLKVILKSSTIYTFPFQVERIVECC